MTTYGVPAALSEGLSDKRFAAIAQFVEQRVGIQLPPSKRLMVEGRLRKRVRALGLDSLDAYASHLFEHGDANEEVTNLLDCVTTNKTDFFREPTHFDFLTRTAVPTLIARRPDRMVKIWSAASSVGAEAFTIAMVLQEMVRAGERFRFSVLGTDISSQVIEEARAAIYPAALAEPVPAALRQRYLMESRGGGEALVRVVPELRRMVQFHSLNLMEPTYPFDRDVDVVFCRNVLIYFDKPTQKAVVERLTSHLRPGGYMVLGHSESAVGSAVSGLKQILPTVYQA